jgi:hypothetical protein
MKYRNLREELQERGLTVKPETSDCRTCGNKMNSGDPACDACEWIQIGGVFPWDRTWVIEKTGWIRGSSDKPTEQVTK